MAWCVAQSRFLTGPRSLPRVGDRLIGIKSLRIGVEQMYRPRIGAPMLGIRQKMAIGGTLRANDDETNTCREFTLGGIGQTSSGYAPNQRQQDSCSSRR